MKRLLSLLLALLVVLGLCACGDGGGGEPETTIPTEFEGVPGMSQRLPDEIHGSWHSGDGPAVDIYPDAVATPDGYFTEYIFHEDSMMIELFQDGQLFCTVYFVDDQTVMTVDQEGNEMLFHSVDEDVPDGDDWQEPMDEAERLNMAYNKALDDFNAAISCQPVYDEEGNEIYDGPALAEYLYNQFLALGDYEDAWQFLSFFKTREELVTTVECYMFIGEEWGGDRVTVYDESPIYDVFGRLVDETKLISDYGIYYNHSGNQSVRFIYNEDDTVTQAIIRSTNGFGDVIDTCVADLEYNTLGQHIATRVAFVDDSGNDVRYTSTLEYDDGGNLIRIDIPYYTSNEETGTYTALYAYDEQGRLLRYSDVALPDDMEWFERYSKRPFFRVTSKNIYDENGLLIIVYSCFFFPDGTSYSMTTYSYDENGRLANKAVYSYDYDSISLYESGKYTAQEINDFNNEMTREIFGLPESYEDRTRESWVNNEDFDLSEWDWVPHTLEVNTEYTYTYDNTVTIMYIDLTP